GYWAASDAYQNSILDRMSSRIKAAGISDHFPTNLAPRTLRRAPVGQSTMIQYIASPCCSTATCMAQ
ncbi:MAG TPA: hypothetical protein VFA15_05740, partial [Nitrososphaera sp.]|nr:hypothetical protein [Nitrososphaera sp.]